MSFSLIFWLVGTFTCAVAMAARLRGASRAALSNGDGEQREQQAKTLQMGYHGGLRGRGGELQRARY